MTRLFFLLLISLLFTGRLSAQTDTAATPVRLSQDSAHLHIDTSRHSQSVKHRSDSTHRRAAGLLSTDSARRARTTDSIARARGLESPRQPGLESPRQPGLDSARRPVLDSATTTSSQRPGPDSARRQAPEKKGPEAAVYWMAVLRSNPYFNFLGTPVILPFQEHKPKSKDSLFYLIVGILFYFALIRMFFEKYFGNLMTLFFRVSLRQQQIREQVLQAPLPSLLLNILFILSGGLYACFLLHFSKLGAHINFWLLYLDCMAGLIVIYLLKFVVLKFCGWVFNISRATDTYIFVVFLVNKMMGIFLLPFLIVITFSGPELRDIFITISFVMIFILLLYRVFAAYRPVRNEIKLTLFYFFLYLCAFEIAPLLLIYKMLLSYLEKVY